MTVKPLETKRLYLKAPSLSDAESYQRYFADSAVIQELAAGIPTPYPSDGALVWLRDRIIPRQGKQHWAWGLFLKIEPTELIGLVELWRPGTPENRGFWLGQPFWGQGLMSEACDAITSHAFQELGFQELIFSNAVGNHRSARIKEKMACESIGKRPGKFMNPHYTEQQLWRLSKERWASYQATKTKPLGR